MIDKSSLRPLIAATLAVTLASTAIAIADSGLPNIPAHRHFV